MNTIWNIRLLNNNKMEHLKKTILPILLAGIWINISETLRWMFLVKPYWLEHHQNLGIVLPEEPVNMIIWMIWGFIFAATIFIFSRKFNLWQTTFFSWFLLLPLLWIVLWNLGLLPEGIVLIAGPLGLIEAFIAALICQKMSRVKKSE